MKERKERLREGHKRNKREKDVKRRRESWGGGDIESE